MKFANGSDLSGDSSTEGQQNHISIIVGTEEEIDKLYKDIGLERIHMSKLSVKNRKKVSKKLKRLPKNIRAWCFYVERQRTEDYIKNHKKFRDSQLTKKNLHKNFDGHLLQFFKQELENFITPFGIQINELIIQTDDDMKNTIKNWNMKNTYKGRAYELADAVAWCNQKGTKIDCKVVDLRDDIKKGMKRDLLG